MAIDNRTPALDLPLPHQDNTLEEDVLRLRGALTAIDTAVSGKQAALGFTPENTANKGVANGYADLDSSGKVPAARLPSFVDDVLEFATLAAFPATGESGKIYIAIGGAEAGKTYRWSGSAYVEISASPGSTDSVPEGAVNLYFTDARARSAQLPATAGALGVIKVGAGLNVGVDGTLAVTGSGGGGTGLPAFDEVFIVPTVDGTTNLVPAGGYIAGQIELLFNGAELYGNGDDYTASDGVNIALNISANTTDKFLLRRWKYLPEGNALNRAGDSMTGALNEAVPVTLASGATLDVVTANSNTINVSGTATIGSLGTAPAGVKRRLISSGTPKYTHNAVSLIMHGGVDRQTDAGDVLEFLSLGSGNWRCISFIPFGGLGTLDVLPNAQAGAYTLILSDRGKSIDAQGNVTVPANSAVAFPVGSTITVTNVTASSITIGINTDTLRLAGTTTTGTRTLAGWGVATMRKISSTVWIIGGAGLT